MKLIKIENKYINIDKIINIYETKDLNSRVTVIQMEGITAHCYGNVPTYKQIEIYTKLSIEKVVSLINENA